MVSTMDDAVTMAAASDDDDDDDDDAPACPSCCSSWCHVTSHACRSRDLTSLPVLLLLVSTPEWATSRDLRPSSGASSSSPGLKRACQIRGGSEGEREGGA